MTALGDFALEEKPVLTSHRNRLRCPLGGTVRARQAAVFDVALEPWPLVLRVADRGVDPAASSCPCTMHGDSAIVDAVMRRVRRPVDRCPIQLTAPSTPFACSATVLAGVYFVVVAPADLAGSPCSARYTLIVSGTACTTVTRSRSSARSRPCFADKVADLERRGLAGTAVRRRRITHRTRKIASLLANKLLPYQIRRPGPYKRCVAAAIPLDCHALGATIVEQPLSLS